jgi:hypothetical protein
MTENGAQMFQKRLNESAKRILQRAAQHIKIGYERRRGVGGQELFLAQRRVAVPYEMYTTLSLKCLNTTMFVHAGHQYVRKSKTQRFGNDLSYLQRLTAERTDFLESVMISDETRVHLISLKKKSGVPEM